MMGWQKTRPIADATFREWSACIADLAPRSDCLTWLHLAWEPGELWEPVERWCVWQMRPRSTIRLDVLQELQGPHPRSTGHLCRAGWCQCAIKLGHWRNGATSLVDTRQWELFRETGCWGRRYWIVQGRTGGNVRFFTSIQAKLSRIAGGPEYPPVPGELAYAPIDNRVLAQLGQHDKMRAYGLMTDFLARNHRQMDAEEREGAVIAARASYAWIKRQMQEVVSEGGRRYMRALAEIPRPVGYRDTTDYDAEFAALLDDEENALVPVGT